MTPRFSYFTVAFLGILLASGIPQLRADGPKDNLVNQVRPIPPVGNELPAVERAVLEAGVDELGQQINGLRKSLKDKPDLLPYLPDVIIFRNAVHYPLTYHEMIDPSQARKALAEGMERAKALAEGKTPWIGRTGARGYVSRIDDSVQPYGISLPTEFQSAATNDKKYRLDMWSHGRDETLTELKFVLTHPEQEPDAEDKFVLRLYGRYCNANKFAGEIDALEALEAVSKRYPIDPQRILNIGFSMGGAACWQFAVHYPDRWAAASPGAGFSETPEFLRVFQHEDVSGAPWYEQTLYRLYDCTDWVANLHNLPTICYAGEIDSQKQASDIMLKAAEAEHVKLERLIGPKTGHSYEPATKKELDQKLDALLARQREVVPQDLRFTTYTLRYNRMYWVQVDALEHHWQPARVEATLVPGSRVEIKTKNVTALSFHFPSDTPSKFFSRPVLVDGTSIEVPLQAGGEPTPLAKVDGKWRAGSLLPAKTGLRKVHGLQGPIDDAFMDRFLIVRPTGKPLTEKTGEWVKAEMQHAIGHWRKQFRGEARMKDDRDVTDADIADSNLVLFGDPSSNRLIGRISDKLPIRWTSENVTLGSRAFKSDRFVPVTVYPNPLNPSHYVVLNSGFTFREYDYLNNARQTPKLPDYAIVDTSIPRTSRSPGGIAAAGFFGEEWELLPDDGKSAVGAASGSQK